MEQKRSPNTRPESVRERRLTALFKEVGSNLTSWGKDTADRYIAGPVEQQNPVKAVMGSVMAVASAILEAPDAAVAGAFDNPVKYEGRTGLRTTRDVGQFAKNVVTLHPIRAVTDAWRVATTDIPLDLGDAVGGFTGHTRTRAADVLATAA
ncbi:MAG: hypothetical protein PHX87_03235 [Candidatus Peribacteraceae bacterium]|nr:hypothetical protein [Candidatus Peribacteraceae bacterium]MDD5742421.1 hypothetical protein [Candidatus Peribacteraceae bacterium]